MFQFSPAISFIVNCENQAEIYHYWNRLSEEGAARPCGWLEDKFGISWQIVPTQLGQLIEANPDKVMSALLEMSKIELGILEAAAQSE